MATQGPPIECSIALLDDPTQRMAFESFPPDGLDENYGCSYSGKRGRASEAVTAQYSGGDFGDLDLKLVFVAGMHVSRVPAQNDAQRKQNLEQDLIDLENKARWLQALAFPKPTIRRSSSEKRFMAVGSPPFVLVTFGQFTRVQGVVQRVNIQWSQLQPETVRPKVAEVSLSIKRVASYYSDWYDIVQRASCRESLPPLGSDSSLGVKS
jgi:hypothetical protein